MSLQLEIPDSVSQALRLPPAEQSLRLKTELDLSLYAQGILTFGRRASCPGWANWSLVPSLASATFLASTRRLTCRMI
jgi:hypothetical protein